MYLSCPIWNDTPVFASPPDNLSPASSKSNILQLTSPEVETLVTICWSLQHVKAPDTTILYCFKALFIRSCKSGSTSESLESNSRFHRIAMTFFSASAVHLYSRACLYNMSSEDRLLGRVVKGESCVQSHSDLDGVGSILAIPNA